uniref:Uncharacterized protein n=1 Tax=Anguilla anguilla TaxID=7936 RepID=A0A0E9P9P1_ANGAN
MVREGRCGETIFLNFKSLSFPLLLVNALAG